MRPPLPILGHPLIDRQHQRLRELGRRLITAVKRGKGLAELGALQRAAERHFATEDRLMVGCDYPLRAGHLALHDGARLSMQHMRERLRQGQAVHLSIADRVVEWLGHHADAADRNLVAFLQQARLRGSPITADRRTARPGRPTSLPAARSRR